MSFAVSTGTGKGDECTVKEWVRSIQHGSGPDRLTELNKLIESSAGGFGSRMEKNMFSDRDNLLPIWEFRYLEPTDTQGLIDFTQKGEAEVVEYHRRYQDPPHY